MLVSLNYQESCKVEFIQPSCWLYSVPNLFVFQQLVTLYLGGFVVRVVSEIECWMLKSVQENRVSRLDLASDSWLQAARSACQKLKRHASWSTTGQNRTTGRSVIAWLDLATQSSREPSLFWKTWRFTFFSHPSVNTPYTHKKRELPKRILREKP